MDTDKLFINSIDEISRIIQKPNDYALLRSTLLLRQLLLDGNRLIDVVNRKRKHKIVFEISNEWESENATVDVDRTIFIGIMEGLLPSSKSKGTSIRKLSLSRFLKFNVFFMDGKFITIRDVINHCAHIIGGVHVGEPKTEKEKLLSILQVLNIDNYPIQIIQLLPILMVVRDGLTPLYRMVKTERNL